ncbi:hypothetical protein ACOMHN_059300 [Nucella lapillus]
MPGDKEEAAASGETTPVAVDEAKPEEAAKTTPGDTPKGEGEQGEGKAEEEGKVEAVEEGKVEAVEEEEVAKMKSVVLMGFGGPRMMRMIPQSPPPAPAEGQLLIRVATCGMSFQDLLLRQGIVDSPPRTPLIMGSECGGVVEALGPNTTDFSVGDRVIALTKLKAWAELVLVPANQVYRLPDSVSFEHGVCLLVHYITAYILLFDIAGLRPGHSFLLHSAAGGVGQAILQLAATVGDVTIFGTASAHKHGDLQGKVTHLFPHNKDYVNEIRKLSPGGLDIVLDCLCGEDTNRGISLLKPLGKYVLYGSGNLVTGDTKSYFSFAKSWWQVDKVSPIRLCDENRIVGGFHLRHLLFRQAQHAYIRSVVDKLLDLHAQGKVAPVVDSVWAFEDVGEGMQRLQDRKNVGKVLLDPTKEPTPKKRADTNTAEGVEAVEGEASKKKDGTREKTDPKTESDGKDQKTEQKKEEKKTEEKKEEKKTEKEEKKEEEKTDTTETPAADAQ